MKFNLDCDIENLAYILYMEEQEKKNADGRFMKNKITLGEREDDEHLEIQKP